MPVALVAYVGALARLAIVQPCLRHQTSQKSPVKTNTYEILWAC
jgi:hypothetical protein